LVGSAGEKNINRSDCANVASVEQPQALVGWDKPITVIGNSGTDACE